MAAVPPELPAAHSAKLKTSPPNAPLDWVIQPQLQSAVLLAKQKHRDNLFCDGDLRPAEFMAKKSREL